MDRFMLMSVDGKTSTGSSDELNVDRAADEGGLPTPRVPSEIKDGVVMARDGRIVDKEFRAGAAKCLEIAMSEQPDLIVLQSRSPSCGVKQRYDGTFTGTLMDGAGVTAQLLMENGFRCVDVEDL